MATATSPVFVGRSEELGRLLGMLARAEQGRPAVALVAGDAGVGKTRLLAELAGHAERQGARVLVGGCMEVGDLGLPYVPFVDAFRDLGARPGESDLAGPLAAAVPGLGLLVPRTGSGRAPAVPPSEGFERMQLFDGVLSLLVGLSELAPLLLVIEDLHWADRSTRDLVAFLIRTLRTGRIALIASYRSDDLHRRHPLRPLLAELVRVPDLERIELRPFTRAELAEYLESLAGEGVPPAAVERILARTEGNAFFAEELVAAGAIRAEVALPDALADVLLGRVEALPELAQEVLKVAAVAGRRVGHQLLVAAAGLPEPELERGLREAIAGQVLVADPATESYRFRHALLQEVVYGDLLPGERTRLHATYARVLAGANGGGSAAELAYHALASHDLREALAARVRAAADAMAMSAPAEAFRHLDYAFELWDQVPGAPAVAGMDRVELLLRAAEAASHSGESRHAVKLAQEAVAAIGAVADPARAALANERLGEYVLESHSADEAHDLMLAACRRAVELVPADPPTPLRARVAAQLGRALMHLHEHDEARRCWSGRAPPSGRPARSASRSARRRSPGWSAPRPSGHGSRATPTRTAGRSPPTPSPTATCTRRPARAGASPRRCWRTAAATRPRRRPAPPTAWRRAWGPSRCGPRSTRSPAAVALTWAAATSKQWAASRPASHAASWRCCAWWPRAAPTSRSPTRCSSAARRPASTSATSSASSACTPGSRPPLPPTAWALTRRPSRRPGARSAPVAGQHRSSALSNRAGGSCGLPAHHRGRLVVPVDDQNVQWSVGSTVRSVSSPQRELGRSTRPSLR